jgi:hypothetical protein
MQDLVAGLLGTSQRTGSNLHVMAVCLSHHYRYIEAIQHEWTFQVYSMSGL